MNPFRHLPLLSLLCALNFLLSGCLIKPARVPVRQFILAPIATPEQTQAPAQPLSVEVGLVKMPSYLLRTSMVLRKSATEVEYLENALWAERLDHSFRQTVANNLSSLLASNKVTLPEPARAVVRVSVDVKQFDVDTQGRGTLIASWRLTFPETERPVQTGESHLSQTGPSPSSPQVIATTLSALTAEFSKGLAKAIDASILSPQK